jgi:hypothetical protein
MGSISFRSDGIWLWLDDLPEYIDKFNVALPSAFLGNILQNQYVPPPVGKEAAKKLEWPPVAR